jgi:hypothetical protein
MKRKLLFYTSLAVTVIIVSVFSACKKSSDGAVNTGGSWKGTAINTAENSTFALSLTLTQSGANVSGQFITASAGGTVAGTVSGHSVLLKLTPAASSGYTEVDTLKGNMNAASTEMSGNFNSSIAGISGTFDVKKQ